VFAPSAKMSISLSPPDFCKRAEERTVCLLMVYVGRPGKINFLKKREIQADSLPGISLQGKHDAIRI